MSPSSKRSRREPVRPSRPPVERRDTTSEDGDGGADLPPVSRGPAPVGDLGPPTGRFGRLAAFAGVAYALVGFVGWSLLPVGEVEPTDSAADIARQLVDDRGRISAGILLTFFSLFFFIIFLSWLHRWLRDAEGEGGWVATVALVGGVLLVAMLSVVTLLSIGATVLEDFGGDPVIARTLLVLQWQAVAVAFIPSAAFVGGTAFVGYITGTLPRWLNYSGMAIALGLLIPPLAFLPFLLSSLWTGMLAIMLLQRSRFRL